METSLASHGTPRIVPPTADSGDLAVAILADVGREDFLRANASVIDPLYPAPFASDEIE